MPQFRNVSGGFSRQPPQNASGGGGVQKDQSARLGPG
jgi:hypothetical protein